MAANFDSYLSVRAEDIEAPKPLPLGHFHAEVTGWKTAERDYKNGEPPVPVVELSFKTTGPDEDVDPSDLPANGGVGVVATKDYRLAEPTNGKVEGGGPHQIRRLAESLDLDVKGLDLRDILDALKSQSVKIYNEPRQDKRDESIFYNNITKVLAP